MKHMHRVYNCGCEILAIFAGNCVQKPEQSGTSTGFEPVTSRYRCDALTNCALKPLTVAKIAFTTAKVHSLSKVVSRCNSGKMAIYNGLQKGKMVKDGGR